jgi:acyl-CoA hydrolase
MTQSDPRSQRTVAYSSVTDQVHMVFPNDLNANDTVFGGLIMALMDRLAVVVASRHAGRVCVTAGVDAVNFIAPARRGDVLIYNVAVNRAWNTSMEVGCKVDAERIGGGDKRHIISAYLTFVAMDEQGTPQRVPELTPQTDIEKQRFEEAALRRSSRLAHAAELRALRERAGRARGV